MYSANEIEIMLARAKYNLFFDEFCFGLRDMRFLSEGIIKQILIIMLKDEYGKYDKRKMNSEYLELAADNGVFSEAEYLYGNALLFNASAAEHNDLMSYNEMSAILHYEWLEDIRDLLYKLAKSEGFCMPYDPKYINNKISDYSDYAKSNLYMSIERFSNKELKRKVFNEAAMSKQELINTIDLILSTLMISNSMSEDLLERSDIRLLDYVISLIKLSKDDISKISINDITRASFIIYYIIFESKETHKEKIQPRNPGDHLDDNLLIHYWKRGKTITRYEQYHYEQLLKPLCHELNTLWEYSTTITDKLLRYDHKHIGL